MVVHTFFVDIGIVLIQYRERFSFAGLPSTKLLSCFCFSDLKGGVATLRHKLPILLETSTKMSSMLRQCGLILCRRFAAVAESPLATGVRTLSSVAHSSLREALTDLQSFAAARDMPSGASKSPVPTERALLGFHSLLPETAQALKQLHASQPVSLPEFVESFEISGKHLT